MSAPLRLGDSLGYLVNQVALRMKLALERELAPHGVTAQQWAAMSILGEQESAGVAAIAAALGVDTGATSRLLSRLEAKHLIGRVANPHDRRAVDVRLSARGKKLLPQLRRGAERVLARVQQPLSARERTQLHGALERILAALEPG